MFLAFVKKDCSEVEFINKLQSKYPVLSFNNILLLTLYYSNNSLEKLNNKMEEYINSDKDLNEAVKIFSEYNLTADIDKRVKDSTLSNYYTFFTVKENLVISNKLAVTFAFAIHTMSNQFFKTKVEDILVDATENLQIISSLKKIKENLPDYITLCSEAHTKIYFNSLKSLEIKIIHHLLKPTSANKVCVVYQSTEDKELNFNAKDFDVKADYTDKSSPWRNS